MHLFSFPVNTKLYRSQHQFLVYKLPRFFNIVNIIVCIVYSIFQNIFMCRTGTKKLYAELKT